MNLYLEYGNGQNRIAIKSDVYNALICHVPPVKVSGVALPALSLLVNALYDYGLFFSPYSEVFLKVTVFAIIAVLFGIIG